MRKTLLRNVTELGYFPDHRGYRRPKNPGLGLGPKDSEYIIDTSILSTPE
jgi:hypothetical protein